MVEITDPWDAAGERVKDSGELRFILFYFFGNFGRKSGVRYYAISLGMSCFLLSDFIGSSPTSRAILKSHRTVQQLSTMP